MTPAGMQQICCMPCLPGTAPPTARFWINQPSWAAGVARLALRRRCWRRLLLPPQPHPHRPRAGLQPFARVLRRFAPEGRA